jgi:DNA-binding YbaB/EbfC family protein
MFSGIGQLAGLMGKLPKIKEEMENLQSRLAHLTAEGQSGGGMVTVRVNGKFAVVGCSLSQEAIDLKDREMLEDLIVAAANQAIDKARGIVAAETGKIAAGLGLPPGLNIPGLT